MFERWIDRYPKVSALLLGVLAATGFPPLKLWPIALLAMGLAAYHFMRAPNWKAATLRGWLFGVGHFTFTNAWIATAFTYQSDMPEILGWFAVPLLSLYLAVYPAIAAGVAKALVQDQGKALTFVIAFAGIWIVSEWLRSWVFTGYAWGPFSLALLGFDDRPGLAMLLPWFGTYALSGLAVLLGGAVVWAYWTKTKFAMVLAPVALFMMMTAPWPKGEEGSQPFVIAQPNVEQEELNDPTHYEEAFVTLIDLSMRRTSDAGNADAKRLVFWPESGLPDYLREGYPRIYYRGTTYMDDPVLARRRIGALLGDNTVLLTGAVDLEIRGISAVGAYNVVTALNDQGRIVGSYRKSHLVPYGEYLPMRMLLEPLGLSRLVAGTIDFWEGPGARTLDLRDYGRIGNQICYEIVFSGQVVDRANRPDFIFNPSNDGWFGAFGPPQHFAQARMRAIEEGLPVIRATTTGISGVIDANGIVRASLGRGEEDRLTGFIPPAKSPTLFARLGNWLVLLWSIVFLGLTLVAMRWQRG